MPEPASVDDELAGALRRLVSESLEVAIDAIEPIAAGLGQRRFLRLRLGGAPHSAIARIEAEEDPHSRPAGMAPEPPLEPIRGALEKAGLPVPRRYGHDPAQHIELLEDLGDRTLLDEAARASTDTRRALYAEACGLIPRLQRVPVTPGVQAFERRLDATLFAYKAAQVVQWLLPAVLGRAAQASERSVVTQAFDEIRDAALAAPQRLAHRDFKAQNLHVVREAEGGHARVAMIDLQGAFMAPPEYDLVCLLRDLQVRLPEEEIAEHCEQTRSALPDAPGLDDFDRRFTLLTLSRVGKDLARYRYAVLERGDERYRRFLPLGATSLLRASRRAAGWSRALGRFAELLEVLEARTAPGGALGDSPCAR